MQNRLEFTSKCIAIAVNHSNSKYVDDLRGHDMYGFGGYEYSDERLCINVIYPVFDVGLIFVDVKEGQVLDAQLNERFDDDLEARPLTDDDVGIKRYVQGDWEQEIERLYESI